MIRRLIVFILVVTLLSCQNEEIDFSPKANDTFYVEHIDSKMRVQVRGNTLSDVIIVVVHGGPGGSSYYLSYLTEMKDIEGSYAVAYWDQPLTGASQGNRIGFSVDEIADGLRKVVATLKYRYGDNKKIVLFSESWGGIITTSFLLKRKNQDMVSGWINSDGPHDFNLMDREIIRMAIAVGEEEIAKGKNVNRWTTIVNYCKNNDPTNNYEVSKELNELLGDAEYLIDTVVKVNFETLPIFWSEMKDNKAPFTAMVFNLLSNGLNGVEKDAYAKNYTKSVSSIRLPLLLLWGKYDFIAPPAVADSLYQTVQSPQKRMVLLERSVHNGFLQEPDVYWPAFRQFLEDLP
jgi:pimeloyl-ACP methyl ester carboxylesterase